MRFVTTPLDQTFSVNRRTFRAVTTPLDQAVLRVKVQQAAAPLQATPVPNAPQLQNTVLHAPSAAPNQTNSSFSVSSNFQNAPSASFQSSFHQSSFSQPYQNPFSSQQPSLNTPSSTPNLSTSSGSFAGFFTEINTGIQSLFTFIESIFQKILSIKTKIVSVLSADLITHGTVTACVIGAVPTMVQNSLTNTPSSAITTNSYSLFYDASQKADANDSSGAVWTLLQSGDVLQNCSFMMLDAKGTQTFDVSSALPLSACSSVAQVQSLSSGPFSFLSSTLNLSQQQALASFSIAYASQQIYLVFKHNLRSV